MPGEIERLSAIIRCGLELNDIDELDLLLEKVLAEARRSFNAEAGSIFIREGDELVFQHVQNDFLQKRLASSQKLIFKAFRVAIDASSIAGYVAQAGRILNIPDVDAIAAASVPYQFNSSYDEFSGYKTRSILALPLKTIRGEVVGVLELINARDSSGAPITFSRDQEEYAAHYASLASMIVQRCRSTRSLIMRMTRMIEMHDRSETFDHVLRVGAVAVALYEKWALRRLLPQPLVDKNRDALRMAAMLHDVGKIAVPDAILNKRGELSTAEFETMQTHTFIGARIFDGKNSEIDDLACTVALTHHENWDGSGYPGFVDIATGKPLGGKSRSRRAEEIPIFGRVTAIADVYDAMMRERSYRAACKKEEAVDEVRKHAGTKFDPELADIFIENYDEMENLNLRYGDKG